MVRERSSEFARMIPPLSGQKTYNANSNALTFDRSAPRGVTSGLEHTWQQKLHRRVTLGWARICFGVRLALGQV